MAVLRLNQRPITLFKIVPLQELAADTSYLNLTQKQQRNPKVALCVLL